MEVKTVSKPAVNSAPAPKRSEAQIQAKAQENRPKENESQRPVPIKPNPVVNAQGQITGRNLNVTA